MMLFDGTLLMAGGSVIAIACLDKVAEQYGFRWLGAAVKILLPLAAMIAGSYFLETNEILRWLR
jgi:hypothetical protein